jgi:hypothetical protein
MTQKLPAAIEAERSILGGILLENAQFHEVAQVLKAEDFTLDSHRKIWLKMVELAAASSPIDIVTLVDSLERTNDLRRIGDVTYLSGLLDGIPDRPSLSHYSRMVKDASIRRALYFLTTALEQKILEPTENTAALIENAQANLVRIAKSRGLFLESIPIFEDSTTFERRSTGEIDWLVRDLIQRGANGLVIARPKAGKSACVADLAVALASGQDWFEFKVPQPVRVALVSREDYWSLTHSRIKRLRDTRMLLSQELDENLWVNARGATPKIMLDYPDDVAILIGNLKKQRTEFLILDVMRVLHGSEENDNTEMQKIINVLNHIAEEVGCSICLVHHSSKSEALSVTQNARGASAIFGWAEFAIGISVADEETWTRGFAAEVKVAMAPRPFCWRIVDTLGGGLRLDRVEYTPKGKKAQDHGSF